MAEGLGIICIFGTTILSGVYLVRQSRRARAENDMLRAQGRAELDEACRRYLDVEPVV